MHIGTCAFGLNAALEAAIVTIVGGIFNLQIVNAVLRTKIKPANMKKKETKRNENMSTKWISVKIKLVLKAKSGTHINTYKYSSKDMSVVWHSR